MTRLSRYVPPDIPRRAVPTIAITWAIFTLNRGLDYATGDRPGSQSEVVMRALADIETWGWALVLAATALIAAYASRIHLLVFCGHALLFALYLMITITIAQAAAIAGDGWSAISWAAGGTSWHFLAMLITKPLPPHDRRPT